MSTFLRRLRQPGEWRYGRGRTAKLCGINARYLGECLILHPNPIKSRGPFGVLFYVKQKGLLTIVNKIRPFVPHSASSPPSWNYWIAAKLAREHTGFGKGVPLGSIA